MNRGQSSNDVIPTALHLAALEAIEFQLRPALNELHLALLEKAQDFRPILKIGRTHLQDATPIRLGHEFNGYAAQVNHALSRLQDIRWLGSGPRGGLGELTLPPTQPGSSSMPGKVNPVMCEMVIQVGAQVVGNDAVITFGGMSGNFELNTMLPVIAYN